MEYKRRESRLNIMFVTYYYLHIYCKLNMSDARTLSTPAHCLLIIWHIYNIHNIYMLAIAIYTQG